jgi:hypothetical protein
MKRKLLNFFLPLKRIETTIGVAIFFFALNVNAQNTGDFRSRWNTTGGSATTAPTLLTSAAWELYDATTGLWSATLTIPQTTLKNIYIREGVQQNFNGTNTYGTNLTVGEGNAAVATATIAGGVVTGITVNNAGSLIVFPTVQLLGPATTLATASITSASVIGYDISNPGSGYSASPTITIGKLWTASTVYATNEQVNSGGLLYTCLLGGTSGATAPTGTTASVSDNVLNWSYAGIAATATATIGTVVRGTTTYTNCISAVNIVNNGSGYISMPVTTITDATGIQAVLEARIKINTISVTNGGTGYTIEPSVNLGSSFIAGTQNTTNPNRTVTFKGDVEFKNGATCVSGGGITQSANHADFLVIEGNLITSSDVKFFQKTVGASNVNYTSTTTVSFTNNANSKAINSTGGSISFATVSVVAGKTLTIGTNSNPVSIKLTQATPFGFNSTGVIDASNAKIELLSYPIGTAIAQTIAIGTFLNNTVKSLTINNTAGVTTSSDITVTDSLSQQAGIFTIATGKTVNILSGKAIGGTFGSANYINTAAAAGVVGLLQITGFSAARTFPIGNTGNYLPITVTPTGASTFAANVFKGATDNGDSNGIATADKTTLVDAIYNINRVSGGNAGVKLGFTPDIKGAALTTKYGIAKYNGASWDSPIGTSDDANNTVTSTFSAFGPLRVQTITALPINLTSLSAKVFGNTVKVEWLTKSELNSNKFEVERSTDGIYFAKLAEVKSKGASLYSISDYNPAKGTNYYRLVQYDNNGISEVFGPVSANFSLNASSASLVVYPNPTSGSISLNADGLFGTVNVVLTDLQGKVVYKETINNISTFQSYKLNLKQALVSGQYNLQVDGNGLMKITKVIVL